MPSNASFCYNGVSWGPWNDTLYDLTPCFRETIVDGFLPLLVSILSFSCILAYSRFHVPTGEEVPAPQPDRSTLIRKIILVIIDSFQLVQWLVLGFIRILHLSTTGLYSIISPACAATAWTYFVLLHLRTSPPHSTRKLDLFLAHRNLFYFISFVSALIRLRSNYRIFFHHVSSSPYSSSLLELIFSFLSFVTLSIALLNTLTTSLRGYSISLDNYRDHRGRTRKLSHEVNASLWQWLTFSWIGPLIRLGSRKVIDENDLWGLGFMMQSRKLWRDLRRTKGSSLKWRLFQSNRSDVALQTLFATLLVFVEYSTPFFLNQLLSTLELLSINRSGKKDVSNAIERAYLFVLGMMVSQVLRTLCAGQMFYFGRRTDVRIKAMLQSEIFWKAERRRDYSGVTKQSIDNMDDELGGQGRIVNLMSVDCRTVSQVASVIYHVYTSPMLIFVGSIFLYRLLGISSIFGLLIMFITIPINSIVSRKYKKLQIALMASRDRRVSLTTEIFHMIRLVKLMGWSSLYTQRVLDAREKELQDLMQSFFQNAFLTLLWYSSPIITTVLAFLSYTKFEGNTLTASVAFTSITVFDKLRSPLNSLPEVLVSLISANVSIKRLETFFAEDEVEPPTDLLGEDIIGFTDSAAFKWFGNDSDEFVIFGKTNNPVTRSNGSTLQIPSQLKVQQPLLQEESISITCTEESGFVLRDLNVIFPKGELSIICGPTGSGKSSLLSALLGEMKRVKGMVHMPRVWIGGSFDEVEAVSKRQKRELKERLKQLGISIGRGEFENNFGKGFKMPNGLKDHIPFELADKGVAYVSQRAWLQNASIKENILFGEPFHEERYQTVLQACALMKDLEMFEDRDDTEIGEKGITLSGGQKQRVALARAVYSRAPVLLLDDVLSAVDASTAAHIYEHCLTDANLMAGRTRILVTHHYSICAAGAMLMLQLNEGCIVAQGSPREVIEELELEDMALMELDMQQQTLQGTTSLEESEVTSGLGIALNESNTNGAPHQSESTSSTVAGSTISKLSADDEHSPTASLNAEDASVFNQDSVIESSDEDSAVIDEDEEDVAGDEENRRRRAAAADNASQRTRVRRASSIVGSMRRSGSISNDTITAERRQSVSVNNLRKREARKLVKEEKRAKGRVNLRIYRTYIDAAGGYTYVFGVLFLLSAVRMSTVGEGLWLKVWSNAYYELENIGDRNETWTTDYAESMVYGPGMSSQILASQGDNVNHGMIISSPIVRSPKGVNVDFYMGVYALITIGSILVQILRLLVQYWGSLKASRKLYEDALQAVVRGTFRFFDTTPIGRLQNRFARDFEIIDSSLSGDVGAFLTNMIAIASVIMVVIAVVPQFLLIAVLIAFIYRKIGKLYINTSREIKRLESNTRSPIFSFFGEALVGIATVRAFGAQQRFMLEMLNRIDDNLRAYYLLWACNRWLSLRADMIGSSISFLTGLFVVTFHDRIDPGLAGLSLSMAVSLLQQINYLVRRYTTLEMNLNAVERIDEIIKNPREPPDTIENCRPPAAWPTDGCIIFDHVTLSYAPELNPVLRDITFVIDHHEKVGIVGRTGSGKSTTASALFRVVDPLVGHIVIDGIDITTIGVHDLRSRLSIITQDSQLFSGTIRSNLDPFNEFEDREIWDSLRRVRLVAGDDYFSYDGDDTGVNGRASPCLSVRRPNIRRGVSSPRFRGRSEDNVSIRSLETPVSEEGQNFSLGQRQLLCMARALLRRSKIIVMDEATASVDYHTDALIQKTIREEFSDCTIVCIAHRLETVIDYDKILVLDRGRVVEYDSPRNLIRNTSSFFYKMCQSSGTTDFRRLQQLAR